MIDGLRDRPTKTAPLRLNNNPPTARGASESRERHSAPALHFFHVVTIPLSFFQRFFKELGQPWIDARVGRQRLEIRGWNHMALDPRRGLCRWIERDAANDSDFDSVRRWQSFESDCWKGMSVDDGLASFTNRRQQIV